MAGRRCGFGLCFIVGAPVGPVLAWVDDEVQLFGRRADHIQNLGVRQASGIHAVDKDNLMATLEKRG